MLVNWKGTGPATVPLQHVDGNKHIPVARGELRLWPGVNDVPDNEWEIAKVHLADDPLIEVMRKRADDGKKARHITDLPLDQAIEFVKQTVGPDNLYRLWQEDAREQVRAAILVACAQKKYPSPVDVKHDPLTDLQIPALPKSDGKSGKAKGSEGGSLPNLPPGDGDPGAEFENDSDEE